MAVSQAVVLVGGKGTRLGEVTRNTPKPLLPIGDDRPFLDYLLTYIAARGVEEILLLAGHLGDAVAERYHGRRVEAASIEVLVEPVTAGTGGALKHAEHRLSSTFAMFNGDSFFDCDFRKLETVLAEGDLGAIALRRVEDTSRFGSVEVSSERVIRFVEKDAARTGSGTISAGVYLLRREILQFVGELPCSIEQEVFPRLVEKGRLASRVFDGYFIDIGQPDSLAEARRELPSLLGPRSELG